MIFGRVNHRILNPLTINVPHIETGQLICIDCKSIDWFLYDEEHWSFMG